MLEPNTLADVLRPITRYLKGETVVELQVTEPGAIWVEDSTQKEPQRIPDKALTLEYFHQIARIISNQLMIVDFWRKPYLACTLPGGHRMQLCLGETIKTGVAMSIRVWRPRQYSLNDFALKPSEIALIKHAVAKKWNIIISGGMFSGKTTLTNAIVELIPAADRVISVEDTPELDFSHIANKTEFIVNRLATTEEVDMVEVLKAVTRLRPDRVPVGELNIDNTWIMARILNLGHGGAISTVHADSPELAIQAMLVNVEANGKPISAAEKIFQQRIDLIIQIARLPNSYVRAVTEMWINPERSQEAAAVFKSVESEEKELVHG